MKFLCSNCKAKYQIADEKAGPTLSMTSSVKGDRHSRVGTGARVCSASCAASA